MAPTVSAESLAALDERIRRSGAPLEELLAPGLSRSEVDRRLVLGGREEASDEVRRLWEWHNGGAGEMRHAHALLGPSVWLFDIDAALRWDRFQRSLREEPDQPDPWWSETWIPFGKYDGYTLAADCAPGREEPSPVWMTYTHDNAPTQPVLPSIAAFVELCIDCHHRGAWYWDVQRGRFLAREDRLTDEQRAFLHFS